MANLKSVTVLLLLILSSINSFSQTIEEQLKTLEEDKKIAIFEERFKDVIEIEKKITILKSPETEIVKQPITPVEANTTTETIRTTNYSGASSKNSADYIYSDKIISHVGFGIGTYNYIYTYDEYDYFTGYSYTIHEEYPETIFSLSFVTNRWWANEYLVGGYYIDFSPGDFGSFSYGAQLTGLAEFESIVLPYAAFSMGSGMKMWDEEFYLPIGLRVGTYLFFSETRNIGAFIELNLQFNNEYLPKYRVGLAWSRIKRKAKR